jgi:hypothetical protein
MENQIICPYCKKTISNDSVINSDGKEACLASSFVYCKCGEMVTFSTIIGQLRNQKSLLQETNTDFMGLPWLEA